MLSKFLSLIVSGVLAVTIGLGSQYVMAADQKPAAKKVEAKKEEKKAVKKHKKAEPSGKVADAKK